MEYKFCPECGKRLGGREIGDEGMVPYCEKCGRPWFDSFYTCTITLVVNELGEIALIRQDYVATECYVCVAGYMKAGESAEETSAREVEEEIGIAPLSVRYVNSYYFDRKDMLMLGFLARVKKGEFRLSGEVDSASWFSYRDALKKLRPGSIAMRLCEDGYRMAIEEGTFWPGGVAWPKRG